MAFNGTGSFVRLYNWATDKVNNIRILASKMDGEMDGFATGLSTCVTKDGQTVTTARVPFALGVSLSGASVLNPSGSLAVTATGGTTARDLAAHLGDRVSVKQFGATGLGVSDDTSSIQAAFNSGRSIYFPAGTYLHSGLTFAGSVAVYGEGDTSILSYTGSTNAITISDGAREFAFRDLKFSMAGDGSAFKFVGDAITFEFTGTTIQFPAYLGTTARRGYEFDLASGKYAAFGTFTNTRVHSAGYGLYIPSTSGEVNAMTFVNAEWGACLHGVFTEAFHSQWSFLGGSCEVATDGQNQFVFKNINGITIEGSRFETKNGAWTALAALDYSTHSPIHFGASCQKIVMLGLSFFPHPGASGVFLNEGQRSVYLHGQDGLVTGAAMAWDGGVDHRQLTTATTSPTVRITQQTSQTGDLTTWRNSSSTTISGVSSAGIRYDTYVSQGSVSGTMTIDASASSFQNVNLGGNVTAIVINNPKAGQELTLRLVYNGGAYTVAGWPAAVRFAGGSFTATSTNTKADVLSFRYNGSVWMETSRSLDQLAF